MIKEYIDVKKFSEFYNRKLSEYVKSYISKEMDAKIRRRVYDLEDKITRFQKDEVFVNLVVAGEYNSGKSSVINSILGEKIIPVGPEPMTLAVSIFKYGERRKALIEFEDETFREVSHEEFEKLKHTSKDESGIDVARIKYIHFYYPDPYLNKVNIIDTPGFSTTTEAGDDKKTREAILQKTDVLLWIFNVNNGTVKNSELNILKDLFEKVFNPAEEEEISGELSVTKKKKLKFFCVVNRVDEKGNIESSQVNNVMTEFEKELSKGLQFKVDSLIPYSAKKIQEYKNEERKSRAAIEKLTALLENKGGHKIEVLTAGGDNSNKTISISDNGEKLLESEIINYGPWLAPLDKIKSELEGIRNNARNIMEYSIINDLYSLYKNIKTIADFIISNKIQKEIDKDNAEISFIIQSLKQFKTGFKERISLLKKEFNQKVWPVLSKFFFRFDTEQKSSGVNKILRLSGNHKVADAGKKVYDLIYSAFNIKSQISEEATKICDMLESYNATREYLLLLDKSRKLINDFEVDYSGNVEAFVAALFEKLEKFYLIDKMFVGERSDDNIFNEIAAELSGHMSSEFVFNKPLWKIEEYYDDLVVLLKIVYLLATSDLKSKIEELTSIKDEQLKDLVKLEEFLKK
jgi:ribosome biogenesis GTPase A